MLGSLGEVKGVHLGEHMSAADASHGVLPGVLSVWRELEISEAAGDLGRKGVVVSVTFSTRHATSLTLRVGSPPAPSLPSLPSEDLLLVLVAEIGEGVGQLGDVHSLNDADLFKDVSPGDVEGLREMRTPSLRCRIAVRRFPWHREPCRIEGRAQSCRSSR
jgi:hypothetical protein